MTEATEEQIWILNICLCCPVRFRICKKFYSKKENPCFKPDIAKLNDLVTLKKYTLKLSNDIQLENQNQNSDNSVHSKILRSALETLLRLKSRIKNYWFDDKCKEATENKNKAYRIIQKYYTWKYEEKHKDMRKVEKKLHKNMLEGKGETGDPADTVQEPNTSTQPGNNPVPSLVKVMLALKKLEDNRSTGLDCVPSELLKINKPSFINAVHYIMIKIWTIEEISIE
ncbi:hypothetical protein TNCV_4282731 [Trichonephila clavipes]|nr:hypothetical protein TNCV_4282731 [Trichonephila clavipes]